MLGVDIIIVDLDIVEPIPVGLKAVEVNDVQARFFEMAVSLASFSSCKGMFILISNIAYGRVLK